MLRRDAARLQLLPDVAGRLQPVELWALVDGDARQWNRVCQLAAWVVMMIASVVPKFSKRPDWRHSVKGRVTSLLAKASPPGYRKDLEEKRVAVRRPRREREDG